MSGPMNSTKREKELHGTLLMVCNEVVVALDALDIEMKKPSDNARGKRIAAICNRLEMANDRARYFALGIDYRTDGKRESREKEGKDGS